MTEINSPPRKLTHDDFVTDVLCFISHRASAHSQTAAVGTQISKFFPKSADPSSTAETANKRRKRAADVPVDLRAASDDDEKDDEPQPSTSAATQSNTAGKRTLRENIQRSRATITTQISDKPKDTAISKFFHRAQDDDDDMAFETPKKKPKPAAKMAVKRTRVTKAKKAAPAAAAKTKQQPSAKNMIRERFFSDVMAQHSARDGVDADELQMALAMSRSMAEQQHPENEQSAELATTSAAAKPKATKATKEKAVFDIFQSFGIREGYKGAFELFL